MVATTWTKKEDAAMTARALYVLTCSGRYELIKIAFAT
jgi:hypothetical protein